MYLDQFSIGGLILDDPPYVNDYRRLLPTLNEIALDAEESRSFTADLADECDRGSVPDAVEQLHRLC